MLVTNPHLGLRILRVATKLTQAEAAAACGVSTGYWSELESGRRAPQAAIVERIATILGIAMSTAPVIVEVPGVAALAAGESRTAAL